MWRNFALIFAAFAALWVGSPAQAENRVALIIGNSRYLNTPALDNPANDAADVAAALTSLGFHVALKLDATKRQLDVALAQFARDARSADAALFYYAGHGMQFQGRNYLMPIDAELQDEVSLRYEMSPVDDVKDALQESKGVKILVLDSCRNNPLATKLTRSISLLTRDIPKVQGLARAERVNGMVIVYATQADAVAADGLGRNSPFSEAFLRELKTPGLEVATLFRKVEDDVFTATQGQQAPEMSISMVPEYYLNANETDQMVWARIRAQPDRASLQNFLARFPTSFFAPDARVRLELIERQDSAAAEANRAEADRRAAGVEAEDLKRRQADLQRVADEARAHEQKAAEDARNAAAEVERLKRKQAELEQGGAASATEAERLKAKQAELEQAVADAKAAALESERLKKQQADTERAAAEARAREKDLEARLAAAEAEKAKLLSQKADAKPAASPTPPAPKPAIVAALPPPTEPARPEVSPLPGIRDELKRLGCYEGAGDDWNSPSMKSAVAKYARYASLSAVPSAPDSALLDDLKNRRPGLCPPDCSARETLVGGRCVAKTCPHGDALAANGACVRIAEPVVTVPKRAVEKPKPKAVGGGHCFSFNGSQYCE